MRKTGRIFRSFLCACLSTLFVLTAAFPDKVYAQRCGNVITDEDIARYFEESKCTSMLIYRMAAIVGERAIPGLRKLLESKRCDSNRTIDIYVALARFGDQDAFKAVLDRCEKSVGFPLDILVSAH